MLRGNRLLNTLSDGKGITGIRFFNEMEDTNESTNLRKLADVWMSNNRCCQGHRNRSAVSVTRITVDIGHPSQGCKRHRMRRHRVMCPKTESMEHGVEKRRWRSSLPVEAGVSGRPGSRYRAP